MYFLILICLKLNITILCSFLFPGCHAFQTRPQLSPVYLLRLVVSRPNGEFGRRICEKYRKFLHKQLKKICFKVRKWSEGNFPLFSDLPKQFPCSLKLFKNIHCSLKVNGYVPLFPKTPGRPSIGDRCPLHRQQLNEGQRSA